MLPLMEETFVGMWHLCGNHFSFWSSWPCYYSWYGCLCVHS